VTFYFDIVVLEAREALPGDSLPDDSLPEDV
jgi:hypothetical protein